MRRFNIFSSLFLLVFIFPHFAQSQVITGQVTHAETGEILIGANIVVINKNLKYLGGASTDFDGNYRIEVDSSAHFMEVSYVGCADQRIMIKGQWEVNIKMGEGVVLDEVVVIDYKVPLINLDFSSSSGRLKSNTNRSRGKRHNTKNKNTAFSENPHPNENYAFINENDFKSVGKNPLSTFSVDVDAAAYSNIRRHINNGNLPPVDAVRIEEMINYFKYDYMAPEGNVPFSVNHELSNCPWNTDHLLLHVGLQGKQIPKDDLAASNIVFLLDVSGSMDVHNKLPLLKKSLKLLTKELRPDDQVAIVVYAGAAGLVLPSTNNKTSIIEALDNLKAGGSTAGGAGLKLAYQIANENFIKGGNNRIVLATDGDFNVGQSSNSDMERMIIEQREKGIAISVLGFGMGNYKDSKMEIIADKGNGNYAYIDNIREAKKVLVKEFSSTLFTIAKDVKFQVEFNPAFVSKYRLIGYENRLLAEEDFKDDKKDAGEIGAGHSVTALYEIIPAKKRKVQTKLKYQTSELTNQAMISNELITLKLRYKPPTKSKSKLIEIVVKNEPLVFEQTSDNFRFSAAIASFGMLMRNSKYLGKTTWQSTRALAKKAKGKDEHGYRQEMIQLMAAAEQLSESRK